MVRYGYLGAVRDAKGKSQRNIVLLERQVADGIDTPFLDVNLGSEYAAAGDGRQALARFERAWAVLRDDPDLRLYGFAFAVCREGTPDVAALSGLAAIARARGLDDDADLLAGEAQALAAAA